MRFLFTFAGGTGHFVPTAVYARALRRRGHEVLYGCQEGMVATVRADGWAAEGTGGASLLEDSARRPLAPVDREAEVRVMRSFFAGKVALERSRRLGEVIAEWRPDMVLRDEVDFGAAFAAEAAGLPHAAVVVIAAGSLTRPDVTETALAGVRSELGLDPERANQALHRYLLLVPVPPSFRDPRAILPATARHVRPAVLEEVSAVPSTGPADPSRPPEVYFTLGTIFPQESGDLFERVLAGLAALPVSVTVTTGGAIDPAQLGPQPPGVRLARFLPLAQVLPRSNLVVSHGGSGAVVASLTFGHPQLLLPMGADQPDNADRCAELGVGTWLDPLTADAASVADAVTALLRTPDYRARAAEVAREARSLPDAEHTASLIEAVAHTRVPVTDL